ncbi:MAG: cell division protein FtsA [Pseudomonadota bacterium]|nr:cell division protein FtsA [Pseudomonadota bacterium]
MAKLRTGIIAALDIGSTKICCFIAHMNAEGGIRVIGVAQQASGGVRNGSVVDMEAAQNAILTAISAAEELAGERIDRIFVNLSAGAIYSHIQEIEVSIAGHEIAATDIHRARERNSQVEQPEDRDLIHCLPVGYSIDGNRGIRDPRGMFGEQLGVSFHRINAAPGPVRNLKNCVARCHLDIEEIVFSSYAAGLSCLVEDEKDLGVTLVDMGGGTTTIAVFYDGQIIYADSISVGGTHVTNDVARGLSTPVAHAERMKNLYGSAVASQSDDNEIIDVPLVGEDDHNSPNHVPRSILTGIIRPRIEETFELVRESLDVSGLNRVSGRRLVLTGGGSQLHGVQDLASMVLEKQARIGRPLKISGLAEATSGPAFSTCAGLLRYGVEKFAGTIEDAPAKENAPPSRISRIGHWLKESF